MLDGVIAAGASLVATAVALAIGIPLMHRIGLLDHSIWRSSHHGSVPRSGGLAVLFGAAAGFGVGTAVTHARWSTPLAVGLVVVAVLAVVGLIDDLRNLSASSRLAAHVVGGVALASVMSHGGSAVVVMWLVSAFLFVAFVNAFNFMDGINGISGLHLVVIGVSQAMVGHHLHQPIVLLIGAAMAGAAAAFLPFNMPTARTFLGDGGAYGLAALVAVNALLALRHGGRVDVLLAPGVLYGADTCITLVARALRGADLRQGHREHAYQRLVAIGQSHTKVALGYAAFAAVVTAVVAVAASTGSTMLRLGVGTVVIVVAVALVVTIRRATADIALPSPPPDEC